MEEMRLEQNEIETMENSKAAAVKESSEAVADQMEAKSVVVEPVEVVVKAVDAAVDEVTQTPAVEPKSEQAEAPTEDFKGKACEKLREEQKKADNKQFAEPVIGYLLKRCKEDNGLAQDVMQEHKTWKRCFDYIYNQARKQAKGNTAAVRDDVVYEWAEDYYHKDDKAEEEKKAKEAAGRKKKEEENKKKAAEMKKSAKKFSEKKKAKEAPQKVEKEKAKPAEAKPKKNQREMDGQMDLFSLMGM